MKYIKTIIFLFVLFAIPITIYASENSISFKSINIEKRSAGVFETEGTSIEDNKLFVNINMSKVGNSADYKVTVQNNTNQVYTLSNNAFNSKSQYIKYSLGSYDNTDELDSAEINILPNSANNFRLKIDYVEDIPQSILNSGAYNENIEVSLDKQINNKLVVNPKTGIKVFIYFVIIGLVSILFVITTKKRKSNSLLMLIFALTAILPVLHLTFIPKTVFADDDLKMELSVTIVDSTFKTIEQAQEGFLTPGDEVFVGGEHFYVVSTDNNDTVLLTKYNLYVGDVFLDYKYQGSIDTNEPGYGYQATEVTNVHVSSIGKDIGVVPFSGKTYWLDENDNIKEKYGSSSSSPIFGVDVYDSTFNNERFNFDTSRLNNDNSCINGLCFAMESDYSIAYFVDNYVNLLRNMGVEVKEGRLLTDTEMSSLGCSVGNANYASCPSSKSWLNQGIYWLGSLYSINGPRMIERGQMWFGQYNEVEAGVRPIIVVDTDEIQLLGHDYFENKPPVVY